MSAVGLRAPRVHRRVIAAAHAGYYLFGGAWPLLSMRTFLRVTGRKRELWLVRTIAGLLLVIGALLGDGARRGEPSEELARLGAGSGAVFAAIDVWYGLVRRRIPLVYVLDGAIQLAFAAAWARTVRHARRDPGAAG